MNPKPIPQRISAFLLCFALLVGLLPTSALAADTTHNKPHCCQRRRDGNRYSE